jgi:hypothetical protein
MKPVQQLNLTITGKSASQVGIQFGAYSGFLSFFGLAQLPAVSVNFTGIVDYASSMTFELVTNATVSNTSYPSNDDISVRFLFANGTTAQNPLTAYPLFGQKETVIPWNDFVTEMNKFAIGDQATPPASALLPLCRVQADLQGRLQLARLLAASQRPSQASLEPWLPWQ